MSRANILKRLLPDDRISVISLVPSGGELQTHRS